MDKLPGVHVMDRSDITDAKVHDDILNFLDGRRANVVMRYLWLLG